MAALMPTRLPSMSTSAPPELPGLIAASVWMKFSKVLMPKRLRPVALTMPWVTVCPTPKGSPTASTTSPTCTEPGSANVTGCRPVASTFSTARSVSGSVPSTRAAATLPSGSMTAISLAPSTTWLLVRM
jgi:hypothetical protein